MLETTANRTSYTGAGTTGPFSFPYYFLEDDDLTVIKVTIATGAESTLVLTTDYTVSGAGEAAGGSVTLVASLSSSYKLVILRDPDALQSAAYPRNDPFPSATHERVADKLTMLLQRVKELVTRSIRLPDGDTSGATLTVPIVRANKALIFDASGNVAVSADNYEDQAANAAASAAAALASENAAAASEGNAAASETLAEEWATKTIGQVAATDYSSKAYAIGGTGIDGLIGSAKQWAVTVGAAVIAGAYSAKEWAVGTFTRGSAGGGSAKDWATYTAGTVDNAEYSAKKYAQGAAASAASVGARRAATVGGTVNAITATFSPAFASLADSAGIVMAIPLIGRNTSGTVTLAADGLAATAVVKTSNDALVVGDIPGGDFLGLFVYDASLAKFQMLNPAAPLDVVAIKGTAGENITTRLQAAIDGLPADGGEIYLPAGSYTVGKLSWTKSGVHLRGAGMGATRLTLANNTNDDMFEVGNGGTTVVADTWFMDLTLRGNSANQTTGHGIHSYTTVGLKVLRCEVRDFKVNGIRGEGTATGNDYYGEVAGCYIVNNGGDGVLLQNQCYSYDIHDNVIAGNGKTPAGGNGVYAVSNDTHRIANNLFDENEYGIRLFACSDCVVVGNMLENCDRTAILCDNSGGRHTIVGNTVINPSSEAADTYMGTHLDAVTYCTVSGNAFYGNSIRMSDGIREGSGADLNVITGNTIYNAVNPITRIGASTKVFGNIGHSENTLDRCAPDTGGYVAARYYSGAGIALNGTATLVLAANTLYAIPMAISQAQTWTRIGVYVSVASAGAARLGIYKFENGKPTSLVLDAGTVDTGLTGAREVTISKALPPGAYALVIVTNATPTIYATAPSFTNLPYVGIGTVGASDQQQSGAHVYAALPSTFPTVTYANANLPNLWLRTGV